jgi:predicted permease
MAEQWLELASAVTGVFLVMLIGGCARHWKWFTKEVDQSLATFTSHVLMPSLFFHRIILDRNLSSDLDAWFPALVGFLYTSIGILIAWWIAKSFGRFAGLPTASEQRTFALSVGINNYGYIALPLADLFYPACVVTLMIHNVGVDLALWSVGLFTISGKGVKDSWKRIVFSPPLLAVLLAVTIKHWGLEQAVPEALLQTTEKLGRCSVPMGLVLSGAILYDYSRHVEWDRSSRILTFAIVMRLILLPWLILAMGVWWTNSESLKQVFLLQAAMPAATFPVVMTRLYKQSVETAWIIVVGTSLLSLFTIPIWMVIGRWILGL